MRYTGLISKEQHIAHLFAAISACIGMLISPSGEYFLSNFLWYTGPALGIWALGLIFRIPPVVTAASTFAMMLFVVSYWGFVQFNPGWGGLGWIFLFFSIPGGYLGYFFAIMKYKAGSLSRNFLAAFFTTYVVNALFFMLVLAWTYGHSAMLSLFY